jgi:hypothetical protein
MQRLMQRIVGLLPQIVKNCAKGLSIGRKLPIGVNRSRKKGVLAVLKQHKKQVIMRRRTVALATGLVVASTVAMFPAIGQRLSFISSQNVDGIFSKFTPSGVDSKLAAKRSTNNAVAAMQYRFTPSGIDHSQGNIITVAARISAPVVRKAVALHAIVEAAAPAADLTERLHNSDFKLKEAKGWNGFSLAVATGLNARTPISDIAAKGGFKLDETSKKPSRFNSAIRLDKALESAPSPRGKGAAGEYKLDVGGSYSISRRIAVTAGVSYKSERDRLNQSTVNAADNEAVYVGTKIHF